MQPKKKKKKRGSGGLAALIVLLVTAAVIAAGVGVAHRRQTHQNDPGNFIQAEEPTQTELNGLGKFDWGTTRETETQTADGSIDLPGETKGATSTPRVTAAVVTNAAETAGTTAANDPTGTTAAATSAVQTTGSTAASTVHDYAQGEDYAYAYAGFKPVTVDVNAGEWSLMLVNRNYILPQDYSPELAEAAAGTGVRMDARVAPYYQQMYNAAKNDGITLTPLSGHRRISTQKTNFENKIKYYMGQGYDRTTATQKAAEIILPPGTSEHNAGLAMDIISLDVSFENTEAFRWLQNHAQDYGFILRYPKDKEKITGITYEPWHWRYVGVGYAREINQSGLCLEEYLGAVS